MTIMRVKNLIKLRANGLQLVIKQSTAKLDGGEPFWMHESRPYAEDDGRRDQKMDR